MKAFLFGLILGLIIIPVCVYEYFATGSAPVATAAQANVQQLTAQLNSLQVSIGQKPTNPAATTDSKAKK